MHDTSRDRSDDRNTSKLTGRSHQYDSWHAKNSQPEHQGNFTLFRDQQSAGGYGLGDILRTACNRWRIMLLSGLVGLIIGVIYIQVVERIYKAVAVLEMNVRRPQVLDSEAVIEDLAAGRDADAIFNTRFEKFKSPAMERLATRRFFEAYPASKSSDNPAGVDPNELALMIREAEWRKDSDANIVRVSYNSAHPRFAANLVNVLSECAGLLMMQENQAQSDEAVKWLSSQVEEQRTELEAVESKLADMRKEVQIAALEQRRNVLGKSIISVSGEREALNSRLTAQKTAYEFISGIQEQDSNLQLLPVGLPKGAQLNELIRQWREAHDEFQLAAGRYTTLHPDYRLAKEKEDRARARLEQFVEFTIKEVLNEIRLLEKQIEQLDERINILKSESLDLEQSYTAGMQRVQRLERARDAADTSYQTLLRRMEEARRAADENMAYTQIIREAEVPVVPIRPRKPLALLISLLFTGAIGLLTCVGLEFWRDELSSVGELRAMNMNILGIIPTQKSVDSRGELATIGLRDKFNPMVEIFAGINALMTSEKYRDHSHVLLVCSIMPGEGKTVSTCNMAISAALNGAKTLLIDGDLRRPQLVNIFAIEEDHPSLLDWIGNTGEGVDIEDLPARNVLENLDIISSRPCKDINPAELLGRGRLDELLNWARERYDRIIIDTPPFGPVSDAHVWGNHADALVLVARLGKTQRRALRYAVSRIEDMRLLLLGCIVNDVPNTLEGIFKGAYGYGYGYTYGYRNDR